MLNVLGNDKTIKRIFLCLQNWKPTRIWSVCLELKEHWKTTEKSCLRNCAPFCILAVIVTARRRGAFLMTSCWLLLHISKLKFDVCFSFLVYFYTPMGSIKDGWELKLSWTLLALCVYSVEKLHFKQFIKKKSWFYCNKL